MRLAPCSHLQKPTQARRLSVLGNGRLVVYGCGLYPAGCTTDQEAVDSICCQSCGSYSPRKWRWASGVTTIPDRRESHLQKTIASLKLAGFDQPRIFVDGHAGPWSELAAVGLEVTYRGEKIRPFGNWLLGLFELYIRDPGADVYAMFQDDCVASRSLRQYLNSCVYPDKGYWNLYTEPRNNNSVAGKIGWSESNQCGLGAVGLVFSRQAVQSLLSHPHMIERPRDSVKGWRNLDGGILESFRKMGWKEYAHNPSLIQHTGLSSSIRSVTRFKMESDLFRGEDFDLMDLRREM